MSTGDQPSEGELSAGGSRKTSRKSIQFKTHLNRTLDAVLGLGLVQLEMPSNFEKSKFRRDGYPMLLFDIKDADQVERFKVMKNLSHSNILKIYLVEEGKDGGCHVHVERYLGVLSNLLRNIHFVVNAQTLTVPSVAFQDIVRDIIDGLNHLREHGQYHGNLAWETTLYSNDGSRKIAKLANLETKRSKTLVEGNVADCVSLGYALAEISERVQGRYDVSTCCLIDALARLLISVNSETLEAVMGDIKNNIFFWDERRRKTFAAVELPAAWYHAAFTKSFTESDSVPNMPWTNKRYEGYLAAMELYRAENNIAEYNDKEWLDFLRCISGMYTHEKELEVKTTTSVDSAVHRANPRLFYDLKVAVDASAV